MWASDVACEAWVHGLPRGSFGCPGRNFRYEIGVLLIMDTIRRRPRASWVRAAGWLLLLLALAAGWVSFAAPAVARSHHRQPVGAPKPLVLRARFRFGGSTTNDVWTTGRYVFLGGTSTTLTAGILIDEQTGQRAEVAEPTGCMPVAIGGPWLLFSCGDIYHPQVKLYSLATGTERTLPNFVTDCMTNNLGCSAVPNAVGADWVQFGVMPCYHCSGGGPAFQNIQTGQSRGAPSTNASTLIDLSSPSLTRKACSPLRVPNGGSSLTFDGSFAIATQHNGELFLERCGSRLHDSLNPNALLVEDSHAVLWQPPFKHQLEGLFLPSLRPFVIPLSTVVYGHNPGFFSPTAQVDLSRIALSTRTLYVINQDGQLWTAPAPHPPHG